MCVSVLGSTNRISVETNNKWVQIIIRNESEIYHIVVHISPISWTEVEFLTNDEFIHKKDKNIDEGRDGRRPNCRSKANKSKYLRHLVCGSLVDCHIWMDGNFRNGFFSLSATLVL